MSKDLAKVLQIYEAAWSEQDDAARGELLNEVWSDTGTYQDPTADVVGRDDLCSHIGDLLKKMPGARLSLTSGIDEHHGRLRFTWKLVDAEGNLIVKGIDFGEVGEDGRLTKIVGFFGPISSISKETREES